MRFPMPHFPCEFEIPDDWLTDAGIVGFTGTTSAYRSISSAVLVPINKIEPPYRLVTIPKDWRGFDRGRLVKVLKEIVSGTEIWPARLHELPSDAWLSSLSRDYNCRLPIPASGHFTPDLAL
jgi:hypothetical protein